MFKKNKNYKLQVAKILWLKAKEAKFRSEVLEYLRDWIHKETDLSIKVVLRGLYKPMDVQETYNAIQKLFISFDMQELERIKSKPFIHRLLIKLFPKVFLDERIDLLDTVYVAEEEETTFLNVLIHIDKNMKEWKRYS